MTFELVHILRRPSVVPHVETAVVSCRSGESSTFHFKFLLDPCVRLSLVEQHVENAFVSCRSDLLSRFRLQVLVLFIRASSSCGAAS